MSVPERDRQTPIVNKLANQVKPVVTWADVPVSAADLEVLREIAAHALQPHQVSGGPQPGPASIPASGVVALFAGPNSRSKAMAAEALAQQTNRELNQVNLTEVVSKYIGETEKNLQRVLDAAKASNAILFFDEADALFGKRSEVKDSHDRYASIEINYLLQQLETFHGVAIVATKNTDDGDPNLRKRIGYVVRFPHPPPSS